MFFLPPTYGNIWRNIGNGLYLGSPYDRTVPPSPKRRPRCCSWTCSRCLAQVQSCHRSVALSKENSWLYIGKWDKWWSTIRKIDHFFYNYDPPEWWLPLSSVSTTKVGFSQWDHGSGSYSMGFKSPVSRRSMPSAKPPSRSVFKTRSTAKHGLFQWKGMD